MSKWQKAVNITVKLVSRNVLISEILIWFTCFFLDVLFVFSLDFRDYIEFFKMDAIEVNSCIVVHAFVACSTRSFTVLLLITVLFYFQLIIQRTQICEWKFSLKITRFNLNFWWAWTLRDRWFNYWCVHFCTVFVL